MAQLNFNIHLSGATADAALAAYNKAEAALLAVLQAQGLADKDVVVNAPPSGRPRRWCPCPRPYPGRLRQRGPAGPVGYVADGTITETAA